MKYLVQVTCCFLLYGMSLMCAGIAVGLRYLYLHGPDWLEGSDLVYYLGFILTLGVVVPGGIIIDSLSYLGQPAKRQTPTL